MPAETRAIDIDKHRRWFTGAAGATVLAIAAAKLLVHLYAGRSYGYFVDELYYLACSDHLAWGYVDQPPLIALIAKLARTLFGESLAAIRFLPAVAGAALVLLAGAMARELGGQRFAQGLAALCVLLAPGLLALDGFLSMNAFEPLFWMGSAYLLIRIIKTGNQKLWIWIGVLAGLGLENKHSMVIFGAGIVIGLALTPERRVFRQPWIWIAAAIAGLLFLPNLIWNIQHHFPFLELQANIRRSGRNAALNPLAFFGEEALAMLPLAAPVWLAGLWYFFSGNGRPFRALGWAWLFTASVIVFFNPRVYYLFPAFPLLFAAGAVQWEMRTARWKRARIWYACLMVALGVVLAPLTVAVLPVETYIRYSNALHLAPPRIENHRLGPLPQLYADQFGWDEMASTVGRIYNNLPLETRAKTAIFGQTYGQAGAIDFFGPKYGLPKAISGHQNYFLWGPRDYTGESVIVLGDRLEALLLLFDHVEKAGHVEHPYSMPYQHFDVFYCSGMKQPLNELWPRFKKWN
jgi:4-amino-4-deoxy-L-arabinose transferase-like glycosyltransferase